MNKLAWAVGAALLVCHQAAAQQYFEARNSAMGGSGVASSHYGSAGFANPALLTHFGDDDDFALVLPTVGARVADPDGLLDAIDQFQNDFNALQTALDNSTATPGQILALSQELLALNGKSLDGAAGAGFAFSMPSDDLAFSIVVRSYLDARGFVDIDPGDIARILTATSSADLDNLMSQGVVLGAAVTDVGLAVAHEFDLGPSTLSVGVTPKFQRVDTYNYSINVQSFDDGDFRDSKYRTEDNGVNLDVGAAWDVLPMLTVGAMGRNLIESSHDTVVTNGNRFRYTVSPIATLGAALDLDFVTVTAEVEATKTKRFAGSADDSQYIRCGAELDALGWVQLRGGFQHDLEGTTADMATAGVGFALFDVFHLDVAGMVGSGDTYGAVVQTSLTF